MVADPNIVENAGTNWCSLTCRSIRIGNYKVLPKDKITITEKGVQIKVPSIINPSEVVTLNIVTKDILKVLVHFGKQMPLLFLYISPGACLKTRKLLKMTNSQSFYLDVQVTLTSYRIESKSNQFMTMSDIHPHSLRGQKAKILAIIELFCFNNRQFIA